MTDYTRLATGDRNSLACAVASGDPAEMALAIRSVLALDAITQSLLRPLPSVAAAPSGRACPSPDARPEAPYDEWSAA